jgi:hypothetical protein
MFQKHSLGFTFLQNLPESNGSLRFVFKQSLKSFTPILTSIFLAAVPGANGIKAVTSSRV